MPKVKRERRTPEEAYKFMDQRLRGKAPTVKRDRKPFLVFAAILGGVTAVALAGLLIALFAKPEPAPLQQAKSVLPSGSSCLDETGNLPAFVAQVKRGLGIQTEVKPTFTQLQPGKDGLMRVTMTYHIDLGVGDTDHLDRATGTLDPRFCTTTLIATTAAEASAKP